MDRNEFMKYIEENYAISGESKRLIYNILWFVEHNYPDEDEQYNVLCLLLNGTIGLSDSEIKKISL